MRVILASPRGFCAGVRMAVQSLDLSLQRFGTPLYAFHEIVHNQSVVSEFRERGVIFVSSLDEVPEGSAVLFSAHGVSPEVRETALRRRLRAIDATCPLVHKVHREAIHYAKNGYTILYIGHEGHDEVVGTMGEVEAEKIHLIETVSDVDCLPPLETQKLAYLTQTTLSQDEVNEIIQAIVQKFPHVIAPPRKDICYATQNRQDAVKRRIKDADCLVVLGSQNSSNSQRLREIGVSYGKPSYLMDHAKQLDRKLFQHVQSVLLTAGASTPENVIGECVDYFKKEFEAVVEEHVIEENVQFGLPSSLMALQEKME